MYSTIADPRIIPSQKPIDSPSSHLHWVSCGLNTIDIMFASYLLTTWVLFKNGRKGKSCTVLEHTSQELLSFKLFFSSKYQNTSQAVFQMACHVQFMSGLLTVRIPCMPAIYLNFKIIQMQLNRLYMDPLGKLIPAIWVYQTPWQ